MADAAATKIDHILIVAKPSESQEVLINTLETAGGYRISRAHSFEQGLELLLTNKFALALVDVQLPDLSGIDLLTVANTLHSQVPVILIDDTISAKSAIAAFRLGAIDYLAKPVNLSFVLMRIDRELKLAHKAPLAVIQKTASTDTDGAAVTIGQHNGSTESTALIVGREQFEQINTTLTDLYLQIKAQFVGLVDSQQNLIGAAGRLENADLILLTKAISLDNEASKPLQDLVGETSFHTTHFAGELNGVYIVEFSQPNPVSLIVICPGDVKLGMVWHYSKRAAVHVLNILKGADSDSDEHLSAQA